MNIDDLVLVSIDDHVVEPPNMFDGRLRGQVRRRCAAGREGRQRRRPLDVPRQPDRRRRPERGRVVAEVRVGLRSHRVRRDAPRFVRHPCPGSRHGRQRHHGVDVLSDVRRVQRRPLPPRQGRDHECGHPGVQRLAHRGLVRRLSGSLPATVDRPRLGPAGGDRRDQARRRQGREGDHVARAPAHRRSAQLSQHGSLGARSSRR